MRYETMPLTDSSVDFLTPSDRVRANFRKDILQLSASDLCDLLGHGTLVSRTCYRHGVDKVLLALDFLQLSPLPPEIDTKVSVLSFGQAYGLFGARGVVLVDRTWDMIVELSDHSQVTLCDENLDQAKLRLRTM